MNIGVAAALAKALGSGGSSPSGGGGATVVELTYADGVYTSTMKAGPLWEAAQAGLVIFVVKEDGENVVVAPILNAYCENGEYGFAVNNFMVGDDPVKYLTASSADDYPSTGNEQ